MYAWRKQPDDHLGGCVWARLRAARQFAAKSLAASSCPARSGGCAARLCRTLRTNNTCSWGAQAGQSPDVRRDSLKGEGHTHTRAHTRTHARTHTRAHARTSGKGEERRGEERKSKRRGEDLSGFEACTTQRRAADDVVPPQQAAPTVSLVLDLRAQRAAAVHLVVEQREQPRAGVADTRRLRRATLHVPRRSASRQEGGARGNEFQRRTCTKGTA